MLRTLGAQWRKFEYKHSSITLIIILLLLFLFDSALIATIFEWLRALHYGAAFVAGFFSVSFFTALPAAILLIEISQTLNPWLIIGLATLGSVVGDWVILHFFEDQVIYELKPLMRKLKILDGIRKLQYTRYGRWIVRVLGGFIISTPLPDEMGLALLDLSHLKRWELLSICLFLNALGITALVFLGRTLW